MTEQERNAVAQWNVEKLKKDIDRVKFSLDFALSGFLFYSQYPQYAPLEEILPKRETTCKVVKMKTALNSEK